MNRHSRALITLVAPITLVVLVACSGLYACRSSSQASGDSATHWLTSCSAADDCGGLSCICGICTEECASTSSCGGLDRDAQCLPPNVDGSTPVTCSSETEAPIGLCLSSCGGRRCEADETSSRCGPQPEFIADTTFEDEGDLCGFPAYAGMASDEALRGLVTAEARDEAPSTSLGATLTVPAEDEVFDASGYPPIFTWTSPIALAPSCGGTTRMATANAPGFWDHIEALFVSKAQAHCPPLSGTIHLLRFTIPGEPCTHSVLTTESSWPVDAQMCALFGAAGGDPITVSISSGHLVDNQVTDGPYLSAEVRSFVVMP